MTLNRFGLSILALLYALHLNSSIAGPVARELQSRGSDIGKPKPRPQGVASPIQSTETPLDEQPSKSEEKAPPPKFRENAQTPKSSSSEIDETEGIDEVETTVAEVPLINTCLIELKKHAVVLAAAQPERSDDACLIPNPVELVATKDKSQVSYAQGLILDCRFASAFNNFVMNTVQPLARHHMGSALTSIGSGKGFVCRRRNNALTGKLSEHAFGNAMDLISFSFANGNKLPVHSSDQMKPAERAFFDSLRSAACGSFTTVLGPGSNAAHATHLHLDLGRFGEKKNPYRICE